MDRRDFIKISSSTVGLSLLSLSSSAQALLNCSPFDALGRQQCEAGIDSLLAAQTSSITGGQYVSRWCWVACIEMVFGYHGLNLSQEQIVQNAWGNIERMPGQPRDIVTGLSRNWRDSSRVRFFVSGESYPPNPITVSQDLSRNFPLIIGNMGHTMVVTAMKYELDKWGNGQVKEAAVRDPWPGEGRRTLSAQEWLGTSFVTCLRVTCDCI
ncbi:MAG: hypothetical protein KJ804_21225 [Proteobacteria bacterium]|nr:hypothetical protein [Pseudomonadota bacterium]MBU1060833.1 hypothetical protein [Pseudomonadota bacterium]